MISGNNRRFGLWPAAIALIMAAGAMAGVVYVVICAPSGETTDIRYRSAGVIPGPGVRPDEEIAGLTVAGTPFRVAGKELRVSHSAEDAKEAVYKLPAALLDSISWRVQASDDGRRVTCVTERGIAVWRVPSGELLHAWETATEPMAGPKTGGVKTIGSVRYDIYPLMFAYSVSPDGKLACAHPQVATAGSYQDSDDAVVMLRDLETGQEVKQLVHQGDGRTVTKVAWSADSEHLATYNELSRSRYTIRVWNCASGALEGSVDGLFEQFFLSSDGALLYTAKRRKGEAGISVYRVADSSLVASQKMAYPRAFKLSPDGRSLLVISSGNGNRDKIYLLDAATLAERWSSDCPGCVQGTAFRGDSNELVVTWGIPNEIYGSRAGVKAWDVATGVVRLSASITQPTGVGFTSSGGIRAGQHLFEPIAPSGKK